MKTKILVLFIAFCIVSLSFSSCSSKLSAEQVFNKCSGAVFYVESFDEDGNLIATGSGFFVSEDGKGVTNWHVLENAYSARITLPSTGTQYDIEKCNVDTKKDWAVFTVNGKGFDYLTIGDSSTITNGAEIYTIGSPLGIKNTISSGIISNTNTVIDKQEYIQITAPISHGSSGGALINKYGEVIGITSATVSDGQNINLAIPIWKVDRAKTPDLSMKDCAQLSAELHPLEYLKKHVRKNGSRTINNKGDSIYYLEVGRMTRTSDSVVMSIEYEVGNDNNEKLYFKANASFPYGTTWTRVSFYVDDSTIHLFGSDNSRPSYVALVEGGYNDKKNDYYGFCFLSPELYKKPYGDSYNVDYNITLTFKSSDNYSAELKDFLHDHTAAWLYNILLYSNDYFEKNNLLITMRAFGFPEIQ